MLAEGSSVKGSSQQSWTSDPKVEGGARYFQADVVFFTNPYIISGSRPEINGPQA